jgi:hypothetical protein
MQSARVRAAWRKTGARQPTDVVKYPASCRSTKALRYLAAIRDIIRPRPTGPTLPRWRLFMSRELASRLRRPAGGGSAQSARCRPASASASDADPRRGRGLRIGSRSWLVKRVLGGSHQPVRTRRRRSPGPGGRGLRDSSPVHRVGDRGVGGALLRAAEDDPPSANIAAPRPSARSRATPEQVALSTRSVAMTPTGKSPRTSRWASRKPPPRERCYRRTL